MLGQKKKNVIVHKNLVKMDKLVGCFRYTFGVQTA